MSMVDMQINPIAVLCIHGIVNTMGHMNVVWYVVNLMSILAFASMID